MKKRLLSYAAIAISSTATGVFVSASDLPGSYGTGCALAAKKIYCYGGSILPEGFNVFSPTSNFLALDVSGPITTADNSSSWQSPLSTGNVLPTTNMLFGIAALPSGDGFVMSGGVGYNDGNALSYSTLLYNATTSTWSAITTNFVQTVMPAMATDYKQGNQVFMYGGGSYRYIGYTNTSEYETYPPAGKVLGYQTSIFSWAVGADVLLASGMMSGRIRHSAVQGADGKFYIIGGENSLPTINSTNVPAVTYVLKAASMNEVLVYDINTGWTTVVTNGAFPTTRWHHTTTLLPSGKILLLGGCQSNFFAANETYWYMNPSSDYMFTLDTNTMTWSDLTSAIQPAPGGAAVAAQQIARCYHQSVLVGEDSLFILSGRVNKGDLASSFLILNTTSWVLSNSFPGIDPPSTATDSNSTETTNNPDTSISTAIAEQGSSQLSGGAIGGITVGAITGVALIAIACFFYRRRQRDNAGQNTTPRSEKKGHVQIFSDNDSIDPPPGYNRGTPTSQDNTIDTSRASQVPRYGQAIKPEGNDDVYNVSNASQRIVMNPVKPDGV